MRQIRSIDSDENKVEEYLSLEKDDNDQENDDELEIKE